MSVVRDRRDDRGGLNVHPLFSPSPEEAHEKIRAAMARLEAF